MRRPLWLLLTVLPLSAALASQALSFVFGGFSNDGRYLAAGVDARQRSSSCKPMLAAADGAVSTSAVCESVDVVAPDTFRKPTRGRRTPDGRFAITALATSDGGIRIDASADGKTRALVRWAAGSRVTQVEPDVWFSADGSLVAIEYSWFGKGGDARDAVAFDVRAPLAKR